MALWLQQIFKVVQQDDETTVGKGSGQGAHLVGGAALGLFVKSFQRLGNRIGEKLAEIAVKVGKVDLATADGAEIDDAVEGGDMVYHVRTGYALFQGFEEFTDQGGFADTCATDDGDEAAALIQKPVGQ